MCRKWRTSSSGSGAKYVTTDGYNVAVMEDYEHPGRWKWRFKRADSRAEEYSRPHYNSEEAAKRAVLEKLANAIGLVA
jgi:hypothetical protein